MTALRILRMSQGWGLTGQKKWALPSNCRPLCRLRLFCFGMKKIKPSIFCCWILKWRRWTVYRCRVAAMKSWTGRWSNGFKRQCLYGSVWNKKRPCSHCIVVYMVQPSNSSQPGSHLWEKLHGQWSAETKPCSRFLNYYMVNKSHGGYHVVMSTWSKRLEWGDHVVSLSMSTWWSVF